MHQNPLPLPCPCLTFSLLLGVIEQDRIRQNHMGM